MLSTFVIQPERPDQPEVVALLDALDAYLASLYPPEANFILDVKALLAPEVSFFVARDGGRAVATGAYRRCAGEAATDGKTYGEIKRMFVGPAHRGQRLGQAMVQALEAHMRDAGCALALLETGAEQKAAVRLYESCGYKRRLVFGGYPDNGLSVYYGKLL